MQTKSQIQTHAWRGIRHTYHNYFLISTDRSRNIFFIFRKCDPCRRADWIVFDFFGRCTLPDNALRILLLASCYRFVCSPKTMFWRYAYMHFAMLTLLHMVLQHERLSGAFIWFLIDNQAGVISLVKIQTQPNVRLPFRTTFIRICAFNCVSGQFWLAIDSVIRPNKNCNSAS